MFTYINEYIPVSYTHLDVYKRQTLRNLSIWDMESNVDDEITTASSSSQSVVNVHM